jgi:hypothetical protein
MTTTINSMIFVLSIFFSLVLNLVIPAGILRPPFYYTGSVPR